MGHPLFQCFLVYLKNIITIEFEHEHVGLDTKQDSNIVKEISNLTNSCNKCPKHLSLHNKEKSIT